jgi:hypothetical protein
VISCCFEPCESDQSRHSRNPSNWLPEFELNDIIFSGLSLRCRQLILFSMKKIIRLMCSLVNERKKAAFPHRQTTNDISYKCTAIQLFHFILLPRSFLPRLSHWLADRKRFISFNLMQFSSDFWDSKLFRLCPW